MRTIGFRSNLLFAVAAAFGVIASLSRPWYGPSAEATARRWRTCSRGSAARSPNRWEPPAGRRCETADQLIAGLAVGTAVVLLLTLVPALQQQLRPVARWGALATVGVILVKLVDTPDGRALQRAPPRALPRARVSARARREHGDRRVGALAPAQARAGLHPAAAADVRRRRVVRAASVLSAAHAAEAVLEVGRVLDDLREAHDRDRVLERDLAPVDLLHEVDQLLGPSELGVVVLDVAR